MNFKTPRQAKEFEEISDKLKSVIYMAKHYMKSKYNYDITITDVLRTQDEQDDIYKDNPKYVAKPWQSVHQYGRGVDLRTKDMKPSMIEDLKNIINQIPYDENRPDKKTCLVHNVGKGMHFHVQTTS